MALHQRTSGLLTTPRIRQAGHLLRCGGIIAYPTESVWGLGCDPANPDAVARLLHLKQRPWHKGLILAAANLDQLHPYIGPVNNEQRQQLLNSWPGPHTWIIDSPNAPVWIRGQHHSVAVRVSAHPLVQALCLSFGGAIVSTSANITGRAPARQRWQAMRQWADKVDMISPGQTAGAKSPSTITELATGTVIRA